LLSRLHPGFTSGERPGRGVRLPAVWHLPAGTAHRDTGKTMDLSFVLLAVTVVQSLVIARYQDDDMPRALRIDRASRWIFPIMYLALLALVATTAGC